MNRQFLVGMLGALLWAGSARAQLNYDPATNLPTTREDVVEQSTPHFLSNWITFANRDYYLPPDESPHILPPIGTELFLRVGPSTPFGSGTFAQTLDTGWMIEGGVRALLYNPTHDQAWVIEASISNTYNQANSDAGNYPVTLHILENAVINGQSVQVFGNRTVTVHDLNQTFVNLGGGHDWFLWQAEGKSLRLGIDAGGRWGTGKADFNEIPHRTGILYGGYAAMHADLLIPVHGCFSFVCGVRGEYDIMQNNNLLQTITTLQDVSLLFNVGLRF